MDLETLGTYDYGFGVRENTNEKEGFGVNTTL